MAQRIRSAAVFAVAAAATVALAAPAGAAPPTPVTVVAKGLNDPTGLSGSDGRYLVAESTGRISGGTIGGSLKPSTIRRGFVGPTGVDSKNGTYYIATGEQQGAVEPTPGGATLWITKRATPRVGIDLLAYELENNPDGQAQFDGSGVPYDALSNPYAVLAGRGFDERVFVADAGANDVLVVDQSGTVSTFFVPPVINTGACEGAENENPGVTGCDPVPTGLAWGPDGNLYVSTLSALYPGEGRVYVLDPFGGTVLGVISGFSAPTGVAVGDDGSVYVSEALEGAPAGEGPPPAGFNPVDVGQIVKVDPKGKRSAAQVTMPLGLKVIDGQLYSTAWSLAGSFLGLKNRGEVVRVDASAFAPL